MSTRTFDVRHAAGRFQCLPKTSSPPRRLNIAGRSLTSKTRSSNATQAVERQRHQLSPKADGGWRLSSILAYTRTCRGSRRITLERNRCFATQSLQRCILPLRLGCWWCRTTSCACVQDTPDVWPMRRVGSHGVLVGGGGGSGVYS